MTGLADRAEAGEEVKEIAVRLEQTGGLGSWLGPGVKFREKTGHGVGTLKRL